MRIVIEVEVERQRGPVVSPAAVAETIVDILTIHSELMVEKLDTDEFVDLHITRATYVPEVHDG